MPRVVVIGGINGAGKWRSVVLASGFKAVDTTFPNKISDAVMDGVCVTFSNFIDLLRMNGKYLTIPMASVD